MEDADFSSHSFATQRTPRSANMASAWSAGIFFFYVCVALLTGGGSRGDILSLFLIRPLAVLGIIYASLFATGETIRSVRVPLAGIVALAGIMLAQLIPLPPALWTSLPGRELFANGAPLMGLDQSWHPITLSPSKTLNSLVALLPPLAAILLFSIVPPKRRSPLLLVLILLLVASALLGLAQRMGPPGGALYLYSITNETSAVGFFSNRNHHALVLACVFPLLAAYATGDRQAGAGTRRRTWFALMCAITVSPLIFLTGSRAGLALSVIGLLFALLMVWREMRPSQIAQYRKRILGVGLTVAIGIAAALPFLAQTEGVSRLANATVSDDPRIRMSATLIQMTGDSFPVGIGFGAFEHVFRAYEPFELLDPAYMNNAHSDIVQFIMEAGVAGLIMMVLFLAWFAHRAFLLWRGRATDSSGSRMGRLGTSIVAILLLGSIADYPLRTPFIMVLFVIALGWVESSRPSGPADGLGAPRGPAR